MNASARVLLTIVLSSRKVRSSSATSSMARGIGCSQATRI